jgi:hypothetical protein
VIVQPIGCILFNSLTHDSGRSGHEQIVVTAQEESTTKDLSDRWCRRDGKEKEQQAQKQQTGATKDCGERYVASVQRFPLMVVASRLETMSQSKSYVLTRPIDPMTTTTTTTNRWRRLSHPPSTANHSQQ